MNKDVSVNNDSSEDPSDQFLAKLTEFTARNSIWDIGFGRVIILSSVIDDIDLPEINSP